MMRVSSTSNTFRSSAPGAAGQRHRAVCGIAIGVMLACSGCPIGTPGVGDLVDGNRDDSVTSPDGKTAGEPNDSFGDPIVAVLDAGGVARLQGTIAVPGDIDVYRLPPLDAGTMITVDAATTGSPLDVTVAIFDFDQNLVYANDDRNGSTRALDSYVLWTTRHDSAAYYVVIAASAFAVAGSTTGTYTADIEVVPESGAPPPRQQVILLDFSGAFVNSPVLGQMQLTAFDAGLISPAYTGESARMKQLILETVRQNFERFNVVIYSSDDGVSLPADTTTTVYMGGFNREVFGLAEDVDQYNFDRCDDAIIYTESFNPAQVFSFTPTLEEMALAIGNITAHEAGHLLGLFHVSDDTALMDDSSPADAFIFDQEFKRAPLAGDVVDLGYQDAAALLAEIVGVVP